MAVNLKPRQQCEWDEAALGEIMLRLDPGDGRILDSERQDNDPARVRRRSKAG